jgi:hypothetical protein
MAEVTHPSCIANEVVVIEKGDCGRSCKEHNVCGEVVEKDTLLHLQRVQITVNGHEETMIVCIWVTNGIDCCHVGC